MAKMIWTHDGGVNTYAVFKREFDINSVSEDSVLKICADSEYAVYLNGQFVNCGQYDDFPNLKYYDTLNIAEYLICGKNKLTIYAYHQGKSTFQYSCGRAGVWYELSCGDVKIESDEETLASSDPRYTQGDLFLTTNQYGFGFIHDARRTDFDFCPSVAFDAPMLLPRPVKKCILTEYKAEKVLTQGMIVKRGTGTTPAELMQTDALSFCEPQQLPDENIYLVYDLQKESCGYISFEVDAEEGCIIDIGYGEHLDDMRIRTSVGGRNFANRYICREGKQKFFYPYRRIAGRYISFHVEGKLRSIDNVTLLLCDYPVESKGIFRSHDVFLTRLHKVCEDTLRLCMHEHYEDCPWREQALYGSDSRNQMLFGYYAFREFEFARASIDLLGKTVGDDGIISICSPTDSDKKIPSFNFLWLLAMKEYTEYSGDLTLAQEYREKLKFIYNTLAPKSDPYIAEPPNSKGTWHFYEWSEGCDNSTDRDSVRYDYDGLYQVFAIIGLRSIKETLELIGDNSLSAQADALISDMVNAVNEIFWNDELSMYFSYVKDGKPYQYSELMQIMALYSGAGEAHRERLLELITTENDFVPVTLSYTVYKYDVLMSCGNKYAEYVYSDITDKWGKMLFNGATSFWETILGADDFDNAGSLCHGWSAVPLYILERYACGITPEKIRTNNCTPGENLFYPYVIPRK